MQKNAANAANNASVTSPNNNTNGNNGLTAGTIEEKLAQMERSRDYGVPERMYSQTDNIQLPAKTAVNIG